MPVVAAERAVLRVAQAARAAAAAETADLNRLSADISAEIF